jgi:hypothetical protein
LSTVSEYISEIEDSNLRGIARKLRALIGKTLPNTFESIKMGVLNYSLNKRSIAPIAEYTNHVNLYFVSGAKLSSKLLQGTGKGNASYLYQEYGGN